MMKYLFIFHHYTANRSIMEQSYNRAHLPVPFPDIDRMLVDFHLSSTSHTDTSMTYCQSITQILRITWVRCIPLSLRSKTRRRATPLLPTWIYSCRSRVTVSCELPFTTNVTISTSISQTFRSWVAIFHLRQPMVFLSHSSYGMPGLAPLMNVLF